MSSYTTAGRWDVVDATVAACVTPYDSLLMNEQVNKFSELIVVVLTATG